MNLEKVETVNSFENLKSDLEASNSKKDVFYIIETHLKANADVKFWNNDKWNYVFGTLQTNFIKFTEDRETLATNLEKTKKFVEKFLVIWKFPTFQSYCLALCFGLRVIIYLLKYSDLKQDAVRKNDLKSLFTVILSLLNNLKVFEINSMEMFKDFGNVIELLCVVFKFKNSSIDIKMTLEAWKTILGLLKSFTNQARKHGPQFLEQYMDIIMTKPLNFLFQTIDETLNLMYKTDALKQSPEQIEKFLKVKSFYLKILRQLLSEVKKSNIIDPYQFFAIYTKAKFPPQHLDDTQIKEFLEIYIERDMNELFGEIHQHPKMTELILSYVHQNNSSRSAVLVESYLRVIITQKDEDFINTNLENFRRIFDEMFKESEIHLNTIYEEITKQYAALTLLSGKTEFLRYFRENVLKKIFWLASASVDILVMLQSYQCQHLDYPEAYLLQEFCFWRECNDSFSVFTTDVRQTNVVRLLKNCFQLSKAKNSSLVSSILGQSNNPNMDSDNYKLLLAIGLEEFFESKHTLLSVHTKLTEKICGLINCLIEGQCTVNNYYKIITYLNLLETSTLPPERRLVDCLLKALALILERVNQEKEKFSLFISAVYSLTAKFIKQSDEIHLQKLFDHLKCKNILIKLPGCVRFLSACSRSTVPQLQQQADTILKANQIEISNGTPEKLDVDLLKQLKFDTQGCTNCKEQKYGEPFSKRQCL